MGKRRQAGQAAPQATPRLEGATNRAGAACFGDAAGFGTAWFAASTGAIEGLTMRLRSGLTCLATLSHSARSSSLRPRLRRGGSGNSGIDDLRFIDDGDIGAGDVDAALPKLPRPSVAAREAGPAWLWRPERPGPAKAPMRVALPAAL